MRYLRYTLIILLAFTVSLGVEAKKVKLSKNIVYEGAVQNGEPNGQGSLSIHSCLDKNVVLLTLNGDFNNTEVKDASIKINGGIVVEASKVAYYKLATPSKKEDVIEFHMYLCSIKNNEGIEVKNVLSSIFAYGCDMEADKRWHFFADANSVEFPITRDGITSSKGLKNSLSSEKFGQSDSMSSLWNAATSFSDGAERNKANAKFLLSPTFGGSGVISSCFVDYDTPLSSIGEDASNIKKQDVNYRFFVTAPEHADEALGIELLSAQKTYLSNGVEIEHRDNSFYCKYPNANFVVLNKDGSINNYKIALEGGKIESFPSNTTITYDDGKTFASSNAHAIEVTNNIFLCKTISDIKLANGTLSDKDRNAEIYENGIVVASKTALKDGGFYTVRQDGHNELTYPDGSVFKANTPNGLVSHKSDSAANTSADYTLISGILTNSEGSEIEYKDCIPHYKYIYDLPQASASNPYSKIKEDMDRYFALYNNDAVGYFNIADAKTELQKRAFMQRPDYATDYLPKLQEARKHLMNDELLVWISIDDAVKDFEYDINTGRFNFEVRDTKNKKINANCKDFHFLISNHLCLSYPRSLISMTSGKNYFDDMLYIQKAQTCKVSETDALKFDNNKKDCALVWTFKVEKIVEMELDGWVRHVLYGKTTHLYLANEETEEIYCDLTESLGASQNGFKSSKVIKDNSPKKTYHARGRQENCGVCLGTGQGWQGGICPFCGGKGWRIEHYW